jgi:hypothetical protein
MESQREVVSSQICSSVMRQLKTGAAILRVQDICDKLLAREQHDVKPAAMRGFLKTELGMSYRRIKWIPKQGNGARSLVLRQKFGQFLLQQLHSGKRILNVDESWLGVSDFRRMAWQHPKISSSQPLHKVQPRITIIAAVDNHGDCYFSLLQANSNNRTMLLFFSELARTLDFDRPGWRNDTLVQLDGAAYHYSSDTVLLLQKLGIPFCISAPYSYDGAAAELLFAMLKSGNLNPGGLPLTKSKSSIVNYAV